MQRAPWKEIGRYGSVGIELVASILICAYVGARLDERFGTHWIKVVGFVVGAYAGFRALFLTAKRMQADIERAEQRERSRP